MKPHFLLLASMALMLCGANAQSKLSTATRLLLSEQEMSGISPMHKAQSQQTDQCVLTTIRLVKGANLTDEQLAALDIQVEKRCGTLIFANVPVNRLAELAELEGISKVDTGVKRKPMNDKAREATSVPMVHDMNVVTSTADVPEQYRGKGVLVAIIDMDIDFAHPAFKDADGKSRIKHAEAYTQVPNEYGIPRFERSTYEEDEIEQAILFMEDQPLRGTGHGTHVTGIAAGSTAALPDNDPMKNYYGMAPESELLVYDVTGRDTEILVSLADAIERADRLQRPLVVNMSLGSNDARLDGTDEYNVCLQALAENYDLTGKLFCISAGNEADYQFSVQMECNEPIVDDDWTLQHVLSCIPVDDDDLIKRTDGTCYYRTTQEFSFYASDNRDFAVQYFIMDPTGNEIYAQTPILAASRCMDKKAFMEDDSESEFFSLSAISVAECTSADRTYLTSTVTSSSYEPYSVVAAVYTRSEGMQIDGYVDGSYFDDEACTTPVNSWGSINVMACNDIFIGVGSYNTRLDIDPLNYHAFRVKGDVDDISYFSSYCHPHYGPMNPLCAAPGMFLLSSMHHKIDLNKIYLGGSSLYEGDAFPWAYNAGTSMAAPTASGIIALWLQANPQLTRDDVIDVLSKTCDYDEYCEASPFCFGYGKINAKRGIDYILDQTAGLTSVGFDAAFQTSKYIDAKGHIMIRKGERNYNIMGVEW